jgi:hypothetical protein
MYSTLISEVEHHRQGYPRLAAFLNLDPNFTIFKRFDNLHIRVLLEQQARLAGLEQQLEQCDDDEVIDLNLYSCRHDQNQTRRSILQQIKSELVDYGAAYPFDSLKVMASLSTTFALR